MSQLCLALFCWHTSGFTNGMQLFKVWEEHILSLGYYCQLLFTLYVCHHFFSSISSSVLYFALGTFLFTRNVGCLFLPHLDKPLCMTVSMCRSQGLNTSLTLHLKLEVIDLFIQQKCVLEYLHLSDNSWEHTGDKSWKFISISILLVVQKRI